MEMFFICFVAAVLLYTTAPIWLGIIGITLTIITAFTITVMIAAWCFLAVVFGIMRFNFKREKRKYGNW